MRQQLQNRPDPALTRKNLAALRAVALSSRRGGLCYQELAKSLGLSSPGSARRHLIRLEKLGLVRVARSGPARRLSARTVVLTVSGKETLRRDKLGSALPLAKPGRDSFPPPSAVVADGDAHSSLAGIQLIVGHDECASGGGSGWGFTSTLLPDTGISGAAPLRRHERLPLHPPFGSPR